MRVPRLIAGGLVAAALLCAALAGAAPAATVAPDDSAATTVILVRHAEKNPHPAGGDAGLSVAGLLLPELFTELTGARLRDGEGVGYDRLFVLTLPAGGGWSVVRLRYGAVPADVPAK